MTAPPRKTRRRAARAGLIGALAALALVATALGLFVLAFGWDRLLADFWPLDSSRVGPNLCASMAIVILVTAHNEYRAIEAAEERHEGLHHVVKDAMDEALHPAESAEGHVAADVVEAQNEKASS